jgi:hypothetical protein
MHVRGNRSRTCYGKGEVELNATLDLTWLVLGLVAIGSAALFHFCRWTVLHRERKLSLVVGVAVITAALFPYISSTDDSLRFDHYAAQHATDHHNSKSKNLGGLIFLYEALDAAVPVQAFHLAVTWTLASYVSVFAASCKRVLIPWNTGRSPPQLAF